MRSCLEWLLRLVCMAAVLSAEYPQQLAAGGESQVSCCQVAALVGLHVGSL